MTTSTLPAFPTLRRRFTQDMVNRYGRVNDDRNLIHYEAAAARRAGFPRPVVHGAMVAALLSEACRDFFGRRWMEEGRLKVTFIRPVLVEQSVRTGGAVVSERAAGSAREASPASPASPAPAERSPVAQTAEPRGATAPPRGANEPRRVELDVWCQNEAGERVLVGNASCVYADE